MIADAILDNWVKHGACALLGFEDGQIWFKEKAAWWEDARKEMTQFLSGGKHDDIVDALAWMTRLSLTHRVTPRSRENPVKSWKDKLKAYSAGITISRVSQPPPV